MFEACHSPTHVAYPLRPRLGFPVHPIAAAPEPQSREARHVPA